MTKFIKPKINLWIEQEEDVILGMGRVQLLLLIDELGSLNKAADKLGMSYRSAWGKIKRTEEILGFSLVEKNSARRDGYKLSAQAKEICREFLNMYNEIQSKSEDIFKNYPKLLELVK